MSSVVRIIPKRVTVSSNTSAVHPAQSLWGVTTEGDLTITSLLTGRLGSWVSTFSVATMDSPPIVNWEHSNDDVTAVLQNKPSSARLSISNMDIQPKPFDIFPDTHWNKSGNDLIPRSI
jgi:hypothetical protein